MLQLKSPIFIEADTKISKQIYCFMHSALGVKIEVIYTVAAVWLTRL